MMAHREAFGRASVLAITAAAIVGAALMGASLLEARLAEVTYRLDQIHASRHRLQAIVDKAKLVDSAAKSKDIQRFSGDFLPDKPDTLVAAELQSRLRAIVAGENGQLNSARTLPSKPNAGQNYLGLRLQFQGPMPSIHRIVHAIEYGTPSLFVERMVLRPGEPDAARDSSVDPVPTMFAELDVYGAKWPGGVDYGIPVQ